MNEIFSRRDDFESAWFDNRLSITYNNFSRHDFKLVSPFRNIQLNLISFLVLNFKKESKR